MTTKQNKQPATDTRKHNSLLTLIFIHGIDRRASIPPRNTSIVILQLCRSWWTRDEQGERNNRAWMTENRFDPKDVHKENWYGWTPMIRFCCLGDLALCRCLAFHVRIVTRPIVVSIHGFPCMRPPKMVMGRSVIGYIMTVVQKMISENKFLLVIHPCVLLLNCCCWSH